MQILKDFWISWKIEIKFFISRHHTQCKFILQNLTGHTTLLSQLNCVALCTCTVLFCRCVSSCASVLLALFSWKSSIPIWKCCKGLLPTLLLWVSGKVFSDGNTSKYILLALLFLWLAFQLQNLVLEYSMLKTKFYKEGY